MLRAGLMLLVLLLPAVLAADPLTLEECITRALQQNLDVLMADQSLRRSEADVRAARASRLPAADATLFGYGYSRTGPSVRVEEIQTGQLDAEGREILQQQEISIPADDRTSYSLSASLGQTLYDAGRRASVHRAAQHSLEAAEKNLESRRVEVAAAVKRRYYELLKAAELVEVQEESVKLSEKQLENAQVRLEVGSGTEVDVLRLQVALENARAELINAQQGVVLGRAQLNHIMGAEVRAPLEIAPLLETVPETPAVPDSVAGIVTRAEAGNPALQSRRDVVAAAESDLDAARAAWYPRVAGSLSYSRNNELFGRVYRTLDQNYRLQAGLSVTYNVFDGGIRQASIDRARAGVGTARMSLQQQRRELVLAVETAHLEMVRLDKILGLAERTVELAEEDLRMAQERYRVGKGRLLEVLDAQVGFTQARSSLVRTRYDLRIAQAEFDRLAGVQ